MFSANVFQENTKDGTISYYKRLETINKSYLFYKKS